MEIAFITIGASLFLIDFKSLKSIFGHLHDFFAHESRIRSLEKNITQRVFMWHKGDLSCEIPTIQYSFYTELLHMSSLVARTFGADIADFLKEIKKGLKTWGEIKKKINSQILSSLVQTFIAIVFIQIFMRIALYILGPRIEFHTTGFLFYQLMGLFLFTGLSVYYLYVKEGTFSPWFLKVYTFKLLTDVGLDVESCLERSHIGDLLGQKGRMKQLELFRDQICTHINRWRDEGMDITSPLDESLSELWSIYQREMNDVAKKLEVAKFIFLCLFALLPYFAMMLSFFSTLLFT